MKLLRKKKGHKFFGSTVLASCRVPQLVETTQHALWNGKCTSDASLAACLPGTQSTLDPSFCIWHASVLLPCIPWCTTKRFRALPLCALIFAKINKHSNDSSNGTGVVPNTMVKITLKLHTLPLPLLQPDPMGMLLPHLAVRQTPQLLICVWNCLCIHPAV